MKRRLKQLFLNQAPFAEITDLTGDTELEIEVYRRREIYTRTPISTCTSPFRMLIFRFKAQFEKRKKRIVVIEIGLSIFSL